MAFFGMESYYLQIVDEGYDPEEEEWSGECIALYSSNDVFNRIFGVRYGVVAGSGSNDFTSTIPSRGRYL